MTRLARLTLLVSVLGALLAVAGPAGAADRLFFGVMGGVPTAPAVRGPLAVGGIFSASGDGGAPTKLLADARRAGQMAVHGGFLYWISADQPSVARMRLDGTDVDLRFIDMPAGSSASPAIAVDDDHIWFSYFEGAIPTSPSWIARARLDGSDVEPHLIPTSDTYVTGMSTGASHLFWGWNSTTSTGGGIGRAGLDGAHRNARWMTTDASMGDVDVAGGRVYFSERAAAPPAAASIGRIGVDGSGRDERFVEGMESAMGLAVSATAIYWTNNGFGAVGRPVRRPPLQRPSIGRAAIDGTHVEQRLIPLDPTAVGTPYGIAVGGDLPVLRIRAASTAGGVGTFRVRVSGPGRLGLHGVRVGSTRAGARVCDAYATAMTAGTVTLHCRPNRATRAILQHRAVRVRVTIAFGDGSGIVTATRTVTFARIGPGPVTG